MKEFYPKPLRQFFRRWEKVRGGSRSRIVGISCWGAGRSRERSRHRLMLFLGLLSGFSLITLVASYFLNIDLQTALLIPSGAAILVYVIGSASGIRLLKGSRLRLYPWISLAVSLVMLPFVGVVLVVSVLVALFGFFYRRIRGLRR